MQFCSLNSCSAGRKVPQMIRRNKCIQAAEFSASTFPICPKTTKEVIGSHIRGRFNPLRTYRLAIRKIYWQLRNYHSDPRPKNYFSYPSVYRLLREQGIRLDTANIPATGPNGCLLKGDVLAYLGRVKQDYLYEQSQRLENLSHLDLSRNKSESVDVAPRNGDLQNKDTNDSSPMSNFENADIEVTTSISLDAVRRCQDLLRRSLDVSIPLSRFVFQASKIANEENSIQTSSQVKGDIIFDAITGNGKARQKLNFVPDISSPLTARETKLKEREVDYLDFLAAKWPTARVPNRSERKAPDFVTREPKILSVRVKKDDRSAASIFLKKFKALLELEPGQLII